jgi:hypothetical protein
MSAFYSDAPSLFIVEGQEQSAAFMMNFVKDVPHYVARITGGCGGMSAEQAVGLKHLERALHGDRRASGWTPRFAGFGLYGGTQMLLKKNPRVVVPGVTDVFRNLHGRFLREGYKDAVFLGITSKIGVLRHTPYGIIVADTGDTDFVTVIPSHGTHSTLLIQPNADAHCDWDAEWKESMRIVDELGQAGWQSLLIVYNGGSVTERELLSWAKMGQIDPSRWTVLIVGGSGRTADKYAGDSEFLRESPTVHVCDNNVGSMRRALTMLGALR